MKKLMMAVAVASCAIGLNAAQVNWNSGTMYKQDATTGEFSTTTKVGNKGATGYLFNLANESAYNELLVLGDGGAVDWAKTSAKVWDTYKDSLESATTTKQAGYASSIALSDGKTNYDEGTYYSAIIYTYTDGDKDYYVANLATAAVVADQQGATEIYDLHTKFGGKDYTPATAITGWTAVPEPTSGLLLLLGVAGLALRRRRA